MYLSSRTQFPLGWTESKSITDYISDLISLTRTTDYVSLPPDFKAGSALVAYAVVHWFRRVTPDQTRTINQHQCFVSSRFQRIQNSLRSLSHCYLRSNSLLTSRITSIIPDTAEWDLHGIRGVDPGIFWDSHSGTGSSRRARIREGIEEHVHIVIAGCSE